MHLKNVVCKIVIFWYKFRHMDNWLIEAWCHIHVYAGSLHWRHNGHDGVSSHQPHGCLLNRLFRRRSKKTSKLRVTGLCVGNSPVPVNSPHKGPVTRKMFLFDDVIMAFGSGNDLPPVRDQAIEWTCCQQSLFKYQCNPTDVSVHYTFQNAENINIAASGSISYVISVSWTYKTFMWKTWICQCYTN